MVRCACSSVWFAGRLDWLLQWDVAHSGQKVELASASWAAGFYLDADYCENCRRKKNICRGLADFGTTLFFHHRA